MGSAAEFVKAVDAFMLADKTLVTGSSAPVWQGARDAYRRKVKLPLEVGGELTGHQLLIECEPDKQSLTFLIGIIFQSLVVCRIDFDPLATHPNGWATNVPPVVKGPHWHSWELNRNSFRQKSDHHLKLPLAEPFDKARQFDATLRWYCSQRHISIGASGIELPPKTRLL